MKIRLTYALVAFVFSATAMVSIVLSVVFMAGLGPGSWAGGRFIRRFDASAGGVPMRLYGMLELLIGASGLVVPPILDAGYGLLRDAGRSLAWGSSLYYLASGVWITVALLPWCTPWAPLSRSPWRPSARSRGTNRNALKLLLIF